MDKNVEKMEIPRLEHYDISYLKENFGRLYSYIEQGKAVLAINPSSVLVVGKGDDVVVGMLKKYCDRVDTLDIQGELKPDFVGSVLNIPSRDKAYDVIVCCEVL